MNPTETVTLPTPEPPVEERREGLSQKAQPGLGRRLKALRVSRGLSLKEVAAETGLSASFISMVETGRNEITIGRLVTMAEFYEVGLGDLVPDREMSRPAVLRRSERQTINSADQRVRTELLASWHHGEMTSGFLRFEAGGKLSDVAPHAGPEFVLALVGEVTIEFTDDTSIVLKEGDSVWFEASRRHHLLNPGFTEAHVAIVKGVARPVDA
jgi:transcriptional regulator with XRE-family HTH domain